MDTENDALLLENEKLRAENAVLQNSLECVMRALRESHEMLGVQIAMIDANRCQSALEKVAAWQSRDELHKKIYTLETEIAAMRKEISVLRQLMPDSGSSEQFFADRPSKKSRGPHS